MVLRPAKIPLLVCMIIKTLLLFQFNASTDSKKQKDNNMTSQDENDSPIIRIYQLPQHAAMGPSKPVGRNSDDKTTRVVPLKASFSTTTSRKYNLQQQRVPLRASNNYYSYTPAPTTTYPNYGDDAPQVTGLWSYYATIFAFLVLWVLNLMLPKGARKQFFGSMPRRYSRRRYAPSEVAELSTISGGGRGGIVDESVDDSILREAEKRRQNTHKHPSYSDQPGTSQSTLHKPLNGANHLTDVSSETGSVFMRPMQRSATKYSRASTANTSYNSGSDMRWGDFPPPSPGHPGISRLPSAKILNETMQRLKSRGIRLVAHGVASESKRVWIRFEEDTTSLSWQTEFPRKVPNQLGEISLVMMRGALHRIALPNILYVDVGKKTNALKKQENASVPEQVCFSLLTQNGSLDLQANSRLERDALVSAFSMILDEVHTQDWRSLYAESPETSAVMSSCTGSDLHAVEF